MVSNLKIAKTKLPEILDSGHLDSFPVLIEDERRLLTKAAELYRLGFGEYALLGIWNAAVGNLKRRVEAYGVDLWISVVQEESGRKKYDKDGSSLSERWEGVDDLVLIFGATNLGLLNKKAGKSLEMINWMRNHASAAHDTENKVEPEDVFALALLLQKNLFETPLPDPGHSVSGLFDPVKNSTLSDADVSLLRDEIKALRAQDVRICFGFMLDMVCSDKEPGITNAVNLFPEVWEKAGEEQRKTVGMKYHSLKFGAELGDENQSKNARNRILNLLVQLKGVRYIPDAARAQLYRRAAKKLAGAKDTAYGWKEEDVAATTLAQFGPHVPSVAFEEVYQEILAVWCGNYWGRSACFSILHDFVEQLGIDQIRQISRLFKTNERVRAELSQQKPKEKALELLDYFESKVSIEAIKDEIRKARKSVEIL